MFPIEVLTRKRPAAGTAGDNELFSQAIDIMIRIESIFRGWRK